jgi:hypothetical protein
MAQMVVIRAEDGTVLAIVPPERPDIVTAIMAATKSEGVRDVSMGDVAVQEPVPL